MEGAGQASDAVSAYTHVKMENAPTLLKLPEGKCLIFWDTSTTTQWPKSWQRIDDPVVPLERNLHGHPLAGLQMERHLEKVPLEHGCEKNQPVNVCPFIASKVYSCVYLDDNKVAGKKQNLEPMWKI